MRDTGVQRSIHANDGESPRLTRMVTKFGFFLWADVSRNGHRLLTRASPIGNSNMYHYCTKHRELTVRIRCKASCSVRAVISFGLGYATFFHALTPRRQYSEVSITTNLPGEDSSPDVEIFLQPSDYQRQTERADGQQAYSKCALQFDFSDSCAVEQGVSKIQSGTY